LTYYSFLVPYGPVVGFGFKDGIVCQANTFDVPEKGDGVSVCTLTNKQAEGQNLHSEELIAQKIH
jgi:hypothetical protein